MGRRAVQAAGAIAAISVLMVIAVAFALVPFGFPLMDEMQQARSGGGVWDDIRAYYGVYSGRWASIGLESVFLRYFDIVKAYPLMLSACLVTILAGLATLFHALFGRGSSWIASICAGALVFSLAWVNMPLPSDGLYWFEAALEDPVSLSLALMVMAGAAAAVRMDAWTFPWVLVTLVLGVLTAIVGGMHEDTSSALLGALFTFTVLAYWRRSEGKYLLTFLTVAALASWVVLLVAPGNGVRSKAFPHPREVMFALSIIQGFLVRHFLRWVFDPRLILASLALLLHLDLLESWRHWATSLTRWQRLWIVLAFCGMLSGAMGAPAFLEGASPPNRLILLLYLLFVCGVVTLLVVYAAGSRNSVLLWMRKRWWVKTAVWLGFSALLLTSSNVAAALHELSGEAQAYRKDLLQRDVLLRRLHERNVKAAAVTPLPWHLRVLPVADLTADPKYANNRATAVFYGLSSIRTATRNKLLGWDLATPEGKKEWQVDGVTKSGCVDPKLNYAGFINKRLSFDASKAIQLRLRVKCSLNKKEGAVKPSKARLYWASDKDMQAFVKSKVYPFVEVRAASLANLSRDGTEWSVDLRGRPAWKGTIGALMLRVYLSDDANPGAQDCIQFSLQDMEFLGEAKEDLVEAWEDGVNH